MIMPANHPRINVLSKPSADLPIDIEETRIGDTSSP